METSPRAHPREGQQDIRAQRRRCQLAARRSSGKKRKGNTPDALSTRDWQSLWWHGKLFGLFPPTMDRRVALLSLEQMDEALATLLRSDEIRGPVRGATPEEALANIRAARGLEAPPIDTPDLGVDAAEPSLPRDGSTLGFGRQLAATIRPVLLTDGARRRAVFLQVLLQCDSIGVLRLVQTVCRWDCPSLVEALQADLLASILDQVQCRRDRCALLGSCTAFRQFQRRSR